jgi:hypothetical protein
MSRDGGCRDRRIGTPFPALNASPVPTPENEKALSDLRDFFERHNERLFELLGRRFWDR